METLSSLDATTKANAEIGVTIDNLRIRFEKHFDNALATLSTTCASKRLAEAMRYSSLGGGKRLRPIMVFAGACAAKAGGRDDCDFFELALPSALAIELVHCYSLIHDDLPSMDNDDFRRGKPSCHKAFDEATAILAGDALLSDAFLFLANAKFNVAHQVKTLATAIGSQGMVGGQSLDLQFGNTHPKTNLLKTGALFECACVLGGLSVNAQPSDLKALSTFGLAFGAAFQIKDDLEDGHAQNNELLFAPIAAAKDAASHLNRNGLLVELIDLLRSPA
jgi:geranylgeranyl pyrophosphate synthase